MTISSEKTKFAMIDLPSKISRLRADALRGIIHGAFE
jgi:hypothetical protein